jgi:hypothetical protein
MLTLTTHSISQHSLIAQNLLGRWMRRAKMCRKWKKHGAKPRNRMYLNADSEISVREKSRRAFDSFEFFQNANTMEQKQGFLFYF